MTVHGGICVFFELTADSKIEKTDAGIKELTIRLEALQKEIDTFLKELDAEPENPHGSTFTEEDVALLEKVLKEHTEKLERNKATKSTEVAKKRAEMNIPQHWLHVR